jgi:hypothetical protein
MALARSTRLAVSKPFISDPLTGPLNKPATDQARMEPQSLQPD